MAVKAKVDYLSSGSLVVTNHLDQVVQQIKRYVKSHYPFPWNPSRFLHMQMRCCIYPDFRRNPELLIGQHVISAPAVKKSAFGNNFHRLYGDRRWGAYHRFL